jgi:nitroreductase
VTGRSPERMHDMNDTVQQVGALDAIFTTPAVRRVRPDPIPEDLIWTILDAAIRGPYNGYDERWSWIVVTDQATKDTIGEWYRDAWVNLAVGRKAKVRRVLRRIVGSNRWTIDPPEPPQTANDRAGDYLGENIQRAPLWIFAVRSGIRGEPTLADGASIFGAIQNLMLAARALGIGSILTMLHRKHEREVAELLRLPSDARPIALIPMGYPVSGTFSTPKRRPVDAVTHWERWGQHRQRGVNES